MMDIDSNIDNNDNKTNEEPISKQIQSPIQSQQK